MMKLKIKAKIKSKSFFTVKENSNDETVMITPIKLAS